jgi:hypothetical protein
MLTCLSVRNHEGRYTHLPGMQFAPMSLYEEPFKTPISFSADSSGPSKTFRHIYMPAARPVSLLVGHELVVNTPDVFLLFVPKLPELTYQQVFMPSDASHSAVLVSRTGQAHPVAMGTVLVGLNARTPGDHAAFSAQDFGSVVCFYYQERISVLSINRIGLFIIQHMRSILPELVPRLRAGSGDAPLRFRSGLNAAVSDKLSQIMRLPVETAEAPPVKKQKKTTEEEDAL